MSLLYKASLLAALLGLNDASPVPQYPGAPPTIGSCEQHMDYTDIKVGNSYQGPWQMVSSEIATSNSEDPGSLTATYSTSVGITITEGASLGLNLPDDIGTVGFDTSVAWSKTSTTGYSVGESCPEGSPNAYECGLSGRPYYVDISGTAVNSYSGDCLQDGDVGSGTPFKFRAPVTSESTGAPDGKAHAAFEYAACICSSSKNQTTLPNVGKCPGAGCGSST